MSIKSTMTALADAVRGKTGATGPLSVAAMTAAIDGMIDPGKLIDRTITTATIPAGVTTVGAYAFTACSGLASVVIPSGVTTIGNAAFQSCSSLASVTFPDTLVSIGTYVFYNVALTSVSLPGTVMTIGNFAFSNCSRLTSVTLPAGMSSIGNNAFANCPALTDIYCGFAEGAVSGAPWGATNATIHYNSTGE